MFDKDLRIVIMGVIAIIACIAATNKWLSMEAGVAYLTADDTKAYVAMAKAAPALAVDHRLDHHHSQRVVAHYAVGLWSRYTGMRLETTYRLAGMACMAATLVVLLQIFSALGLGVAQKLAGLAVFAANPYLMRYYLLVPPMLADLVFVLGIALLLLGLVRKRLGLVIAGGFIAALGRQTAILIVPGLWIWMLWASSWRAQSLKHRIVSAAIASAVIIGTFKATGAFAALFAAPSWITLSILTSLVPWMGSPSFSWALLAEHTLRTVIPNLLMLGLLVATVLRRGRSGVHTLKQPEIWAALVMAAGIASMPFLVDPIACLQNESRQSAIGTIAAVVALAYALEGCVPAKRMWPWLVGLAIAIFVSSLHHMYTIVSLGTASRFAAVHLIACFVAAVCWFKALPAEVRS